MNREEFFSCQPLKLILGNYVQPKTPESKAQYDSYLELLYRALSGMNAQTFERVCDQVIKTMARGQKPMPEDFNNAHKALNESYRTNPQQQEHKCPSCGGTGWVYTNMLSNEGQLREHCKPCPVCRRGHPYADAPGKRDWVEMENSPFKLEATEATVTFIKRTFENDFDYTKTPQEIVAQVSAVWKSGGLKCRPTPYGKIFASLKPSEPVREAAPVAVGSPAQKVTVNGEEYEVEE